MNKVDIRRAKTGDAEVLALLGRITYVESHGHFLKSKEDLWQYVEKTFSVAKTRLELSSSQNLYFIIYVNGLPCGYAKLVLNVKHESVASGASCRLEKIYILNEFIPLKLGQPLLDRIITEARSHKFVHLWLTVYGENRRAMQFYQRNQFEPAGKMDFFVNGVAYDNWVFSKQL